MRYTGLIFLSFLLLAACNKDDLSSLAIRNGTGTPIFALPYSSDYTEGGWIQPGNRDEFFSIEHEDLDAFDYFCAYYDSVVVFLEGYENDPVKFFKNGSTVNYDPSMNPFTNSEMWNCLSFERPTEGNTFESVDQKQIEEHFFSINELSIPVLADSLAAL